MSTLIRIVGRGCLIGALLAGMVATSLLTTGCGRREAHVEIRQNTPEEVLETARQMVEAERADLLPELIYAETLLMRDLYRQFGRLLREVHLLAGALDEAFPREVERLRREAAQAAESRESATMLGTVFTGRRMREAARQSDDPVIDLVTELLVDPYAWLVDQADRLGTQMISDTAVALTWDGRMVLPPFGLVIRKQEADQKWYLVLPTSNPPFNRIIPQSEEAYEAFGMILAVFENTVRDLRIEVQDGKVNSLEQTAQRAGEMVAIPAALAWIAFNRIAREDRRGGS